MATVGQLAAGVAHEIRNPLASISGSIELLGQGSQVSDDDRALMAIITREVDRLNGLITELLDYASPRPREVGRLRPRRSWSTRPCRSSSRTGPSATSS